MKLAILLSLMTTIPCHAQFGWKFPIDDNCATAFTGSTATFDRAHDKDTIGGGSLFCRLGITASAANQAIASFKMAVAAPTESIRTGRILKFPIDVMRDQTGSDNSSRAVLKIRNRVEWAEFVEHTLNKRQRAAIDAAQLSDMQIVNSKEAGPGFILGDGLVFFSTRNQKHIYVWHLNLQAFAK